MQAAFTYFSYSRIRLYSELQWLLQEKKKSILPWQANIKHPDRCSFKDVIRWANTEDEVPPCLHLIMPYFRLLACIAAGQSVPVLIHYIHLWISNWYFLGVIHLTNIHIYMLNILSFLYLKTAFHHILLTHFVYNLCNSWCIFLCLKKINQQQFQTQKIISTGKKTACA